MNKIKIQEVLRSARMYVDQGWCQGEVAQDKNGVDLDDPFHRDATCWCATGAISRAIGKKFDWHETKDFTADNFTAVERKAHRWLAIGIIATDQYVRTDMSDFEIAEWNDDLKTDKEQVLQAFDKSIALVGDEEVVL